MAKNISDEHLLKALKDLPAPDPGRGFESRLLASVLAHGASKKTVLQNVSQNRFAIPVAMAASLLLGMLLAPLLTTTGQNPEMAVSSETAAIRPLHVRLDSPVALAAATIRVRLPAHIRIQGYADVRQLEWQADIPAGANQITLPLQMGPAFGREPAAELMVEVEYRGARKTLRYAIPPAVQSAPENQPMTQL